LRPIQEETAMSVLDDYLVDPRLSLLDKTRIQAQVLVPVLRALRSELGKEKADAIVKQALRDWSKQLFAAIGQGIEGSPRRKWAAIQSVWGEVSGKEVEVEILRHDEEALEIDVTHCRFAEFFRALGEPELGALLICETDFDIAAAGGSEVSLTRDQTIMQGAPSCTFRYKFAPR
jgi:predicted ArsR family transcriptional regulator